MKINPKVNAKGVIISQTIEEIKPDKLVHFLLSLGLSEDELMHYGIPGMKWGKRKAYPSVPDGETQVFQPKPGKKVVSKGGKGLPAHDDAVKAAAAKQIAKASTTDALSNQDLQALVNRMNLEQQYSRLSTADVSPGQKFAKELVTSIVKDNANKIVKQKLNDMQK